MFSHLDLDTSEFTFPQILPFSHCLVKIPMWYFSFHIGQSVVHANGRKCQLHLYLLAHFYIEVEVHTYLTPCDISKIVRLIKFSPKASIYGLFLKILAAIAFKRLGKFHRKMYHTRAGPSIGLTIPHYSTVI